nr:uncharacterized protein LOC127347068 [Lolium perenne]
MQHLANQKPRRRAAVLVPWHTSTTACRCHPGRAPASLPPTVVYHSHQAPADQGAGTLIHGLHTTRAEEKLGRQNLCHHRVPGAAAPACLRRRASKPEQVQIGPRRARSGPWPRHRGQPPSSDAGTSCRATLARRRPAPPEDPRPTAAEPRRHRTPHRARRRAARAAPHPPSHPRRRSPGPPPPASRAAMSLRGRPSTPAALRIHRELSSRRLRRRGRRHRDDVGGSGGGVPRGGSGRRRG